MALITFMSDFGYTDHYIAAVKAKILSSNPGLSIVDIGHNIERYNIAHGAFVLSAVFREFPIGTVHVVSVNATVNNYEYVAVKLEEHYFIGVDNGLFGLISDQDPTIIANINGFQKGFDSFPAKNIFAPAAVKLASGANIHEVGTPKKCINKMLGRQLRATKKQISGHVIRVDHYGNLITNIKKDVFDQLKGERGYVVNFARETIHQIHNKTSKVDPGDCYVYFNSLGTLEISINQGNASQLLGLEYDSPVFVQFEEQEVEAL